MVNPKKESYQAVQDNQSLKVLATVESTFKGPWEICYGKLAQTASGLVATEETALFLAFSSSAQSDVQLSLDVTSPSGAGVQADFSGYSFNTARSMAEEIGNDRGPVARIRMNNWPIGVAWQKDVPGKRCLIVFSRRAAEVRIQIDGELVLEAVDPRPDECIIDLTLHFPEALIIHKIIAEGNRDLSPRRPTRTTETFDLHVCIDFYDDLIKNPWKERTCREAMEIYRQNRIKRVYFIDHFGNDNGFWDESPWTKRFPRQADNIRETYDNIGEFLPAFVKAARAEGLAVHAVMKPHDTAFYSTACEGSAAALKYGKIPRFGGPQVAANHFTVEHPEFRVERRSDKRLPRDDSPIIGTIRFIPETRLQSFLDPERICLWTSLDNTRYRRYEGPCSISTIGREIRLEKLWVEEPFLAITVKGGPSYAFGNTLRELIEIFDTHGNVSPLTFACYPRSVTNHTGVGNWRAEGFGMDLPGNIVGALDDYFWLDGTLPLGIGVGRVRYLPGALCAAYPEVQSWWLQQVDRYIAAGVDGIDFRIGCHNRTFDWDSYGFNPPIVRAFRARYGVDITCDEFDRSAWRELRGEFYTEFLQKASARLRRHGKSVQAHVRADMRRPNWHTCEEIHYDWRAWIKRGLLDELTIMNQDMRTAPTVDMIELAKASGLKVNFRPYLNALSRLPSGPQRLSHLIHEALAGRADGFIIYENAAFMSALEDGSARVTCPWLLQSLLEKANSRPA